jgi:MoaA/NifB/PqqE/SkfB family radical SAM enzyme
MRIYDYRSPSRLVRAAGGNALLNVYRKRHLFLARLTPRKILNALRLYLSYAFRLPVRGTVPLHLKVDVAPSCQLKCPVCPHGSAEAVDFKNPALMKFDLFKKLVDDGGRRIVAMSLYNLGEPLLHPRLADFARYADAAGINTYVTTNLSLPLKETAIDDLVTSGLRWIIVAVDGVSAETFGRERIRGDWALVDRNLKAIQAARLRHGRRFPEIVLQFLEFDFNQHERADAVAYCRATGVSELHFIRGATTPWLTTNAPLKTWKPKKTSALPLCAWPYFSGVISSRGEALPCCHHRMAESYTGSRTVRSQGSVADLTLEQAWTSQAYQHTRGMVSNPRGARDVAGTFCEGCAVISER